MKKRRKFIKPKTYENYIDILDQDDLMDRDCCNNFFNKGEYFLDKAKEYEKKSKDLFLKAKEYNEKALKCYNNEECKYEQKVKKCEDFIDECNENMEKCMCKNYIDNGEYIEISKYPFATNKKEDKCSDEYYYVEEYVENDNYNTKEFMYDNDDIIYIKSDCKTYVTPIYDMYYMQNMGNFTEKYPSIKEPYMNKNNNYFENGFEEMWKEYCEMMNKMFNKMMKK
mgnify:CR=1 FL=1